MVSDKVTQRDMQFLILLMPSNRIWMQASSLVVSLLTSKKAFDTVDHGILLLKLAHYGFRGLINDWLRSYLQERAQVTLVGNRSSNSHSLLVEFLKAQFWDHCSFSCISTTFIAAQRN